MGRARQNPNLSGVFTTFSANSPQIYLEIDRAEGAHPQRADPQHLRDAAGQSRHRLCERLQLPSAASGRCARRPTSASASISDDINRLRVRSSTGALVPLGHAGRNAGRDRARSRPALQHVHVRALAGQRGAGRLVGRRRSTPWRSSRRQSCPQGIELRMDRTRLSGAADRQHGDRSSSRSRCCSCSWCWRPNTRAGRCPRDHPVVPMAVLSALIGVMLRGMDNNILTQIGLVVLVGLAAKNAILIVEFARQAEARRARSDRGRRRGLPAAPAARS